MDLYNCFCVRLFILVIIDTLYVHVHMCLSNFIFPFLSYSLFLHTVVDYTKWEISNCEIETHCSRYSTGLRIYQLLRKPSCKQKSQNDISDENTNTV